MPSDLPLENHNTKEDAWVSYQGRNLNITSFLDSHPGGSDILLPYLGKDITSAFQEVAHSESAERMIDSLEVESSTVKYTKIDPYKGTLYQIWKNMDLKSYVAFVNSPQTIEGHMRVFDSPFLEIFSMTPWQVIPAFWLPVISYWLYSSFCENGFLAVALFLVGIVYWTIFEYFLHRFGFHSEPYLVDNSYILCLHYLLHGIHHAFPMDSLRLVFPPALGVIMATFFKLGFYNPILGDSFADAFMAGKILGYIYYDLFHYFSHHAEAKFGYYKFMKSYHMAHHYKDPNAGFGVSNHFWDIVFGTEIKNEKDKDI